MNHTKTARISPLLQEPAASTMFTHHRPDQENRNKLEQLVKDCFANAYDANVERFFDDLFGLWTDTQLTGVIGIQRETQQFFSEQYLQTKVEYLIAKHTKQRIHRHQIVELGNLAIVKSNQARLMIAALAAFLHAAGLHWVICTAITPLATTMRHMGLEPIELADADPHKLGKAAHSWGRYYNLKPKVYFGSINAGYTHLSRVITPKQPQLMKLWRQAAHAGAIFAQQNTPQLAVG